MLRNEKRMLILSVIGILLAVSVEASAVTYEGSFSSGSFSVNQFDESLGSLTEVAFSISGNETVSYSFASHTGSEPASWTVNLTGATISFNAGTGNGDVVGAIANSTWEVAVPKKGTVTGSLTTTSPGTASANYSDSATLSAFTGTGSRAVAIAFAGSWTVDENLHAQSQRSFGTPVGVGVWMVTYYYTPVPEPTSMALLALGAAALGLRRRHGKSIKD